MRGSKKNIAKANRHPWTAELTCCKRGCPAHPGTTMTSKMEEEKKKEAAGLVEPDSGCLYTLASQATGASRRCLEDTAC